MPYEIDSTKQELTIELMNLKKVARKELSQIASLTNQSENRKKILAVLSNIDNNFDQIIKHLNSL